MCSLNIVIIIINTSNNQRLGSAFDDLDPSLFLLCQVVMMSSAPVKSAADARYASQDLFIQSMLSHTISTPICIRSAFFLLRAHVLCKCNTFEINGTFVTYLCFIGKIACIKGRVHNLALVRTLLSEYPKKNCAETVIL